MGPANGNCTNSADMAIMMDADFMTDVLTCACVGMGACECLTAPAIGLSDECSACFSQNGMCVYDNCLAECGVAPMGDACSACASTN